MSELLPCPFCGVSDAFIERIELNSCAARCNSCGAQGPECEPASDADLEEEYANDFDPGEAAARREWNERHAPLPDEESDTVAMPRHLYELLYAQKKDVIDRNWSSGSIPATPKPEDLCQRD